MKKEQSCYVLLQEFFTFYRSLFTSQLDFLCIYSNPEILFINIWNTELLKTSITPPRPTPPKKKNNKNAKENRVQVFSFTKGEFPHQHFIIISQKIWNSFFFNFWKFLVDCFCNKSIDNTAILILNDVIRQQEFQS